MNILDFDKDKLTNFINYECKLQKKIKKSFKFVVEKLGEQAVQKISNLKWLNGKNYDWAVLRSESVLLLIRKYRYHFTFYCEFVDPTNSTYRDVEFSIFTYYSNTSLLKTDDEKDERCENNFIDIDESLSSMLKVIKEGHSHLLWNSAAVDIPKHVSIELAMIDQSLYSIDKLIFAVEELSTIEMQLFAENEMVEMIKKIKIGDVVGSHKVTGISTELTDDYYYDLGLYLDGNHKDVYSLSMWYLNDVKEAIGE